MRPHACTTFAAAFTLCLAGCDLEVPDLNMPGLDQLEDNPTPSSVAAACTGLLIGTRVGTALAHGYVSQLGILGRESYNFDAADPRLVSELLAGQLSPGSPYGGAFWQAPYANIRLGHIILRAVDRVPDFDDSQRSAIRGFTRTLRALDLLRVISVRDTVGAVIDTDRAIGDVGPIAGKDQVYAEIASSLDAAVAELSAGGDAFPFPLSSGFAGFDTPATFLTFNRALRARVAAYQADYPTVLTALSASFIDDAADSADDLEVGVYHSFSTGAGDTVNGLTKPDIFAHPSLQTDAQSNGDVVDLRFSRKVVMVADEEAGSAQELTSNLKFTMYTDPNAPIAIIRNEDLILLRAEAAWASGDLAAAKTDLDVVRTVSGGLAPLADGLSADQIEDEILYNRRYSLLFEGGHRWIDLRRFGRIEELPLDKPDHVRNIRYPLPSQECDARPGEPACAFSSF